MNTNALPDNVVPIPPTAPTWILIVGASTAVITIVFVMYLVLSERKHTKDTRGLVAIVVALTAALAFAFLGGYAKAEGKIPISESLTPIEFGVGGGIAVFVIVYALLWFTWVREPKPSAGNDHLSMNLLPGMTLRGAIDTAAKIEERPVIYLPDSKKFDDLKVKEGRLAAETVEKLIELLQSQIISNNAVQYVVEKKPGTNAIVVKASNP